MKEAAAHSDDASGSGAPRLAGLRGPAFIEAARRLLAEAPPPEDGWEAARAVCADLRRLYGGRLRRVVLFGSFARGDADDDSDVDLLVVLDRVDNYWEERNRLSDTEDPSRHVAGVRPPRQRGRRSSDQSRPACGPSAR